MTLTEAQQQQVNEMVDQVKADITQIKNGMEVLKSAFEYKTFTDSLVQQILNETKLLSKNLQAVQKIVNNEELTRLENILTRLEKLKA